MTLGPYGSGWLAAVGLVAVLHCYDVHDRSRVWQGVALVDEEGWRFELDDGEGRRDEFGPAAAFRLTRSSRCSGSEASWRPLDPARRSSSDASAARRGAETAPRPPGSRER